MRPCPACSLHVRDATCPFCGAAVPAAARSVFAGPATRAAVFSALAGCWTGNTPAEQTTNVEHKTETHEQQKSPPPPATAGTIEGTVMDTTSGGPVAFAQVELVELHRTVDTDGQGHYQFTDVTPGTYTVLVYAHGNNNPRGGTTVAQYTATVTADQGARVDAQVAVPVYHYNPHQAPMPYGAPPARKRVV